MFHLYRLRFLSDWDIEELGFDLSAEDQSHNHNKRAMCKNAGQNHPDFPPEI